MTGTLDACNTEDMPHSPYIARVLLGRQLKKYRIRAGDMSVAEAARRTGISEAKLRKLESATNYAIRLPDIYACSAVYGLDNGETRHLIGLAEGADSHGWYHDYDVAPEFAHFIEQEGVASAIHILELELIAGLFQTEEYLEGLKAKRPKTKGGADQGLRAKRQELVFRDGGPSIVYVTSEAALRRLVGGRDVMRAQIKRLLELDERDGTEVLVIPFGNGAHESMSGAYELMYFADDVFPTTVYLESLHGSHYEEADNIVSHYEEVFQRTRNETIPMKEFTSENDELA